MPAIGGYEGVGKVHSVGPAVKGFSPGDLVIPFPPSSGKIIFAHLDFAMFKFIMLLPCIDPPCSCLLIFSYLRLSYFDFTV